MLKPDWANILNYILYIEDIKDPISSFKTKPAIIAKLEELEWKKHFEILPPTEAPEPPNPTRIDEGNNSIYAAPSN